MSIAYVVSAIPLAVLAIGVALAHFEIASPMTGFLMFVLTALIGIVFALVFLVLRIRGTVSVTPPIGIALLPLVLVVAGAAPGRGHPGINDITTDIKDPPKFLTPPTSGPNAGKNMDFPQKFGPIIQSGYPDLKPLNLPGVATGDAFEQARLIAQQQPGWILTRVDAPARILEGTAVTSLFHFRDDFVIRVSQSKDGSTIDMRSKSRDGKGDLGANAQRIQSFLAQVDKQIHEHPNAVAGH